MELFRPDTGLFFWMLLSFGIVFFILGKFAWPAILKGISLRNEHIASSLLAAEEAQKKVDNLQQESNAIISNAREEQIQILQEGRRIREQILTNAKVDAQVEAAKIIEDAHKVIIRHQEESAKEMERKAVELSIQVAEKILRRQLDNPEEQKELAHKLVDDVQFSKS